eukprot:TRINITY_DN20005_c0_g1_i1.p1 TRINITY_DN20005_c0_g1~~TRINITY_DN20005_c0_g1_i1.p1  ORF type:complete len:315 (+),score=31.79 TRINITY_DN20005_c0_g1_i1:42-947(+)
MKALFESASQRVKGIAFHPTKSWVLASLHCGKDSQSQIQLWDYSQGKLLSSFGEHHGPVRGVSIQGNSFVSGCDDKMIRMFDFNTPKSQFSLAGHDDFVRSVQFHSSHPYILSASDDLTVRIWDWQARAALSIGKAHTHYVMSATFDSATDNVLSASLDKSVCMWNVADGQLKKTNVISGHSAGVNCIAAHPSLPIFATGSDDNTVKLWNSSPSGLVELKTLAGHTGNVSGVLFHGDSLVSASEDKSIRVWDVKSSNTKNKLERSSDRYWAITPHPSNKNLFAAGHDSGFTIFRHHAENKL